MLDAQPRGEEILTVITGHGLHVSGELICSTCELIRLSPRLVQEDMGRFSGRYDAHASVAEPPRVDGQPRFLE